MSNLQNYQHQIPRYVRTAIGSTIPKTTIADHRCYKPSINQSIYQSIYLSLYLSISLSMSLSLYLSIYLSTYLSIFLSLFLSFFLSVVYDSVLLTLFIKNNIYIKNGSYSLDSLTMNHLIITIVVSCIYNLIKYMILILYIHYIPSGYD